MSGTNGHKELSAEDLEALQDLELVPVDVPQWKARVWLRNVSADEGLALAEELKKLPEGKDTEAIFILLATHMAKSDGTPVFESRDQARKVLGKRNMSALVLIQKKALEFHQAEVAKNE